VSAASKNGALRGLKVIDLTQALAGPFCTMLLADLGADVIKVEPPGGDMTRRIGPYAPDDQLRLFGGYFQSINRNKRSITLDLKSPRGCEVLLRMVKGADVLVENFRAGVMDRFGLSYESLRQVNPRLIYACVRGFGDPRTGISPYVDWPAFDIVAQAMAGLMGITGTAPGQPMKTGPAVGDIVPAMLLAAGILAALHHAEQTGEGQFVDVAMYDGVLALCERIIHQFSYLGVIAQPEGNGHPFLTPFDAFPASDGWVAIATPTEHHWAELCRLMGQPELGTDPRFATNPRRVRNKIELREIVANWTRAHTKQEIVATLAGFVPCGPVNTVKEIADDPHVRQRDMVVAVNHPGIERPVAITGSPIKMSQTPTAIRKPAPLLGEDTEAVLMGLGYSEAEIKELGSEGVTAPVPRR
jgi:crotonobetainyl-CoA:carnitine CoA-transferase CaiB-like acyl-CoA transferase